MVRFAGEKRTYLYSSVCFIGTGVNDSRDFSCVVLGHHLILGHNKLAGFFVYKVLKKESACKSLLESLNHFLALVDIVNLNTVMAMAILFTDYNVL